jgi:hypothetical protein
MTTIGLDRHIVATPGTLGGKARIARQPWSGHFRWSTVNLSVPQARLRQPTRLIE